MGRPGEGNREGETILCPLFIAYSDLEIRCEAHMPEGSATVLKYNDKKACRKQIEMFCEGCWQRCEQYLCWKHWKWEED